MATTVGFWEDFGLLRLRHFSTRFPEQAVELQRRRILELTSAREMKVFAQVSFHFTVGIEVES